jgi:hypothetical protein
MIKQLLTQNGTYFIYLNKIIGQGVDGIIYHTIFNSNKNCGINSIKTATKIINKNIIEKVEDFIKIHKISSNCFGPYIYDIIIKENEIYIVMELMDYGLNDWIIKNYCEKKSWEYIKNQIVKMILPIHLKMKNRKVTVGDKNVDNYMFKNDVLKKIDFTMSTIKIKLNYEDIKSYEYMCLINPFSNKMEKILLT